jgi:hypothetical protein
MNGKEKGGHHYFHLPKERLQVEQNFNWDVRPNVTAHIKSEASELRAKI